MKRLLLAATILAGTGSMPAYAVNINWDFGQHPGALGTTQGFSADGETLTARGFNLNIPANLFSKQGGGDENGLGLSNDPTGDNEISFGHGFVQLNLDGPLADHVSNFNFSMGSTTDGEGWIVYGSQDANPFSFTFLTSGTDEGVIHNLAAGYDNYSFFYSGPSDGQAGGDNVLLSSFGGTLAASGVPEPSTWLLGLTGFSLVAALGWKRKRTARFAIEA